MINITVEGNIETLDIDYCDKLEITEDWGLLYCDKKGKIETIKIANRQQANLQCERTILLSMVRRAEK